MDTNSRDMIAPVEAWIDAVDAAHIGQAPEDFLVGYGAVCRSIAQLLEPDRAGDVRDLLTALAACEFVCADHPEWTVEAGVPPIQPLPPGWLNHLDDGSAEYRLAAAATSLRPIGLDGDDSSAAADDQPRRVRPFRTHLEPSNYRWRSAGRAASATSIEWEFSAGRDVVWDRQSDVDGLNAIFGRRLESWSSRPSGLVDGPICAPLSDLDAFIRGQTDEAKLSRLCFSLSLIDAWRADYQPAPHGGSIADDCSVEIAPVFGLIRLCYEGHPLGDTHRDQVSLNRDIHRLAERGDLGSAVEFGVAHLRNHHLQVGADFDESGLDARRLAAATLVPIDGAARVALVEKTALASARPPSI